MKKSLLILLRHGQSAWNQKNLFTGWVDIPLTSQGIEEALKVGQQIKNINIDCVFTSDLIRSKLTAALCMSVHSSGKVLNFNPKNMHQDLIPVYSSWHLNERKYGQLEGMNKDEARAKYGKDQVHIWRRSFDVAPPSGESLEMTMERTLPYFKEQIVPRLEKGETVLVSAHGNSLRSIVYAIENMSEEDILHFEIGTGEPLYYSFHMGSFSKLGQP
jgi:2,3-bisphosphoglycerate-dependent phosphoglycerate mutase